MEITEGTHVRFNLLSGQAVGTVTRVWGRHADKTLTIISEDGRTFVRSASRVTEVQFVSDASGREWVEPVPAAEIPEPAGSKSGAYLPAWPDAGHAGQLAHRMTGWLTDLGADGSPTDLASSDLIEWCRSARDVLADLATWTDAR
jgi:hypothetical protein